jgi:hypothetical protein
LLRQPCPASLTEEQAQVLTGGLLGDFSLYQYGNHVNAGIACGRAEKDLAYLEYQYGLFQAFCSDKIHHSWNVRNGKKHRRVSFRTRLAPVFTAYRRKWYPEGRKIVPHDLRLTPLVWDASPVSGRV